MQFFNVLAIAAVASAAPTTIIKRAGGAGAPSKVSLPAGCPVQSASPNPSSSNFAPTSDYASQMLYQYTLSPGSTTPSGTNDTEAVNDCLSTCYGYGYPGNCTSVYTAHGHNVDEYGSTVYAEFVCMLFGTAPNSTVLGAPAQGDEDANAHALTIGCGARSE